MYGAIIGDICGSMFEGCASGFVVDDLFELSGDFTDDTVCTCAIANAILTDGDYAKSLHDICRRYLDRGYGGMFRNWILDDDAEPYNSFGNGSAMRVSPIGWAFDDIRSTIDEAKQSASVTHNHHEGIQGACEVAAAIYRARHGESKESIIKSFSYTYPVLTINDILENFDGFHVRCRDTMLIVMAIFNESNSFEECIRNAIYLGGDVDTNAAIVGSIAEAYYGIDEKWIKICRKILTPDLLDIVDEFHRKFYNLYNS